MLETIKSSTDISRVFAQGKRLHGRDIMLLVQPQSGTHDPGGRVAFVAGKKQGNAVWRNKAKRRMREIAKALGAPWAGFDVIFIAKRTTTEQMYSKVLHQAETLIKEYLRGCD